MSFHSSRSPKAAKEHRCDECRRVIAVGEVYDRHSGLYEGDLYDTKECTGCAALWRAANEFFGWWDPEERPCMGDLRQELRDELGPGDDASWLDKMTDKQERLL